MLTLSEKLLLLGLHDEKGSVVFSASTALPYGLAGALLVELYLAKRIDFVGKLIKVVNPKPTDNELLNETLTLIRSSDKARNAKYWINTIYAKVKKIQQRLADHLVKKSVLSKEEHSFLWVINYNRYPTLDEKPEQDIRSHIKNIVFNGKPANEEDIALLSLVQACELVSEVFEKKDCSTAKERIEELAKEQSVGKAISQTMEELMAAITMIIVATTVATTVTS